MYTYQKLKELVQGSSKTVPRDWTPNSVKAIVIGCNFLFIAYHVRQPKVIQLDPGEVSGDMRLNGANGSLVNLLKQKQMSCLEEVYVDSAYQNCPGLMDIEEYATSLINTRSRLRYYGYCQGIDPNELLSGFGKAQLDQDGQYSYAGDTTRKGTLNYQTVQNNNWYSKYNLRPDKYAVGDAANGALARYFKRIEVQIEDSVKEEINKLKTQGIANAVVSLYNQDLNNIGNISSFIALSNVLKNEYGKWVVTDAVINCIKDIQALIKPQKLSLNQLKTYVNGKLQPNKSLLNFYSKFFKLYTQNDTDLNLEELVKKASAFHGLSGFTEAVYQGVVKMVIAAVKQHGETHMMLVVTFNSMGIKANNGDLVAALQEQRSHSGCAEVYMGILIAMSGYTISSLKKGVRKQ